MRWITSSFASLCVLACAAAAVAPAASGATVPAGTSTPSAYAASSAPYIDRVAAELDRRSPGTRDKVWWISRHNTLPPGWLRQTPDCWGSLLCQEPPPGAHRFLRRVTELISDAHTGVDFSGLYPPPDGRFFDAIADGLKAASAKGYRPMVRILVGLPPLHYKTLLRGGYLSALWRRLGIGGNKLGHVQVAGMRTGVTSWNHSKVLVVDGRKAIVGGMNWWSKDYTQDRDPINDVSMEVSGPAAADASKFEDVLWDWTCEHRSHPLDVFFAAADLLNGRDSDGCVDRANVLPASDDGDVAVMTVGRLGNGIAVPGESYDRESPPIGPVPVSGTFCGGFLGGYSDTNLGRSYEYRNPGEDALRALIASAKRSVFISQQDMLSCAPSKAGIEAWFDDRVFDALAKKVAERVPVKILVSEPYISKDYTNGYTLSDVAQVLTSVVAAETHTDFQSARDLVCGDVGLAAMHNGPGSAWANGQLFGNHAKVVAVDDQAFYIGSENLYPARLQELGLIVDNREAAATLRSQYQDPAWQWSKDFALIDPGRVCGI